MFINTETPIVTLCPPDFLEIRRPDPVNGSANDFEIEGYKDYIKDPAGYRRRADKQHADYRRLLTSMGYRLEIIPPKEGMADGVFTADPSLSVVLKEWSVAARTVTILSRFSNEERANEVGLTYEFLKQHFPDREFLTSPFYLEGWGDNRYDVYRGFIWSGCGENVSRATAACGRSDIRAHDFITQTTGIETVSLVLKRPCFHVDTAIAPLPRGHIICYKDGMQPASYQKFLHHAFARFDLPSDEFLIPVSREDAKKLACNARSFQNQVSMPLCSDDLQERVRRAGYEVATNDLSCFIGAGGANSCLTNCINQLYMPGGYAGGQKYGASTPG